MQGPTEISRAGGGGVTVQLLKVSKAGGRKVFIHINSAAIVPKKELFFYFVVQKKPKFPKAGGGALRPLRPS